MKKLLIIFLLVNATICNAQKDSLDYQKIASRLDGSKPLNELVLQSAKLLLGNPYVGGTLDISDKETLVINFDKFDSDFFIKIFTKICKRINVEEERHRRLKFKVKKEKNKIKKKAAQQTNLNDYKIIINKCFNIIRM